MAIAIFYPQFSILDWINFGDKGNRRLTSVTPIS